MKGSNSHSPEYCDETKTPVEFVQASLTNQTILIKVKKEQDDDDSDRGVSK